jgi:HAD superfamily hydrolase (TIGR01509 family)
MLKAAIFDMDGTMVDSEIIQSQGFESVLLDEYGIVAEKTEHGTVHTPGMTSNEIWEMLKQKYGFEADADELTAKKRMAVMAALEADIEPMPGLIDVLTDLQTHDVVMAIATSAKRERAILIAQKLGVAGYFACNISGDDVDKVKPAPDAYVAAAESLKILPRECVVFEDTDVGVEAGKAAGMKVIAIPNLYTNKMNFAQADLVVESLEDVSYEMMANLFAE